MNAMTDSVYYLGVDLGVRRNATALALLEEGPSGAMVYDAVNARQVRGRALVLRDVRALELGTPYAELPGVLRRYLGLLRPGMKVHLTVDATGVGLAVVEWLEKAGLGAELHAVVITGGEAVGKTKHATMVPRAALLENLRIRLECGDFRIAGGLRHYEALEAEVASLGGLKKHPNDLAFALALAVWQARPGRAVGEVGELLPGSPAADEATRWRMRRLLEWRRV